MYVRTYKYIEINNKLERSRDNRSLLQKVAM